MNKHSQILTIALSLLFLSGQVLAGNSLDTPIVGGNLQELLQWADAHNPELSAMRYEIEAADERIIPAGSLPDPVLRAELQDFAGPGAPDSFNPLPGQGSGTKYTLMQSFPLWGKRDLRKEVATAEMEQVKGKREATVSEIHARIKSAYAQYYQTVGLKKLNGEILRLLSDLEAVTQTRYSSGLVPQQDVIRAQIEKTMLQSETINLDTEQHHAMTKLNTALGRSQHASIQEPQSLRKISVEKLDVSMLQDKLFKTNPQIATQSAQIAVAVASKRLVEKNRYPDVLLGISPIQRGSRIDSWEAMVEVNIPIRFESRHAQENEAIAMLAAAKERQQSITNQVTGELFESLAAFKAAEKQEQLIANTLIPQAELTFHSALTGYEAGKVDFATLLDAQRSIKSAKQDRLKAQVEQELRITEIEKMLGEEL
jgi:cobalt-zinc-cadmium efflux system outer membrane protein